METLTFKGLKLVAVIALLGVWMGGANAQERAGDAASWLRPFQRANAHYRQGRYDEAAAGYRAMIAGGGDGGPVYYNLGNALMKQGRLGEALWAYECARRWIPRDPDLRANLAYAQSLLSAGVSASVRMPRLIRWATWHGVWSLRELAWGTVGLVWPAAILWMLVGWVPRARRALGWCAGFVTLLGVAACSALLLQTWWEDQPRALTISRGVQVRFAPQGSGTVHFTLPEGTLVRVVSHKSGWAQIQRADGKAGWVEAEAIKPVWGQTPKGSDPRD